jgi:hypothetical protein
MLNFTGRLTQFYFYPIICHNVKIFKFFSKSLRVPMHLQKKLCSVRYIL